MKSSGWHFTALPLERPTILAGVKRIDAISEVQRPRRFAINFVTTRQSQSLQHFPKERPFSLSESTFAKGYETLSRFWAKMEDVNDNMDVVVIPATAKWPDGRFTLQTYSGTSYDCAVCNQWHNNCRCANGPVRPDYRSDHIRWINDPEARSYNFYVNVEHKTDTSGKDDIITKSHGGGNHGYVKHVDNLNACLTWAAKKEFTQAHIEAFVALYNQKKTEWEAKKEADTEA